MENFNKSESIKVISMALVLFHTKLRNVGKDGKNPFFKSDYATLSNILKGIREPLLEAELSFVQFPVGENGLTTVLMHSSGEWIEGTYFMKPMSAKPHDAGSVITYQRRYALGAILGINIDNDDDGNIASTEGKKSANQTQEPAVDPAEKTPKDIAKADVLAIVSLNFKTKDDFDKWCEKKVIKTKIKDMTEGELSQMLDLLVSEFEEKK